MHTNKINDKKYVGITQQEPEKRWRNGHGYKAKCFSDDIKKYGWDNFDHDILYSGLTKEEAANKEQESIRKYNTREPFGYNMTDGGFGSINWHPSQSTREKHSKIQKERWTDEYKEYTSRKRKEDGSIYQSSEFRDKISKIVSGENNPNYGNKWSDEQKRCSTRKTKDEPYIQG